MKYIVHDLEVMGSNPGQVKLGVERTSVDVAREPKMSSQKGFTMSLLKEAWVIKIKNTALLECHPGPPEPY